MDKLQDKYQKQGSRWKLTCAMSIHLQMIFALAAGLASTGRPLTTVEMTR